MLDDIKTVIEIAAILAAGVWAYCKFIKGRLFKHKLEIKVSGKISSLKAGDHVLASINIENSGFTRILFESEYCVLRIFIPKDRPNQDFTDTAIWQRVATLAILEGHKWIEPSEVIQEEQLIYCDCPVNVAVRLEVSVSDSNNLWRASTVTVNSNSKENIERKSNHVRRQKEKGRNRILSCNGDVRRREGQNKGREGGTRGKAQQRG